MNVRTSNIFLTVDVVIFTNTVPNPQLLLIKRKNNPFKDKWALPGGFVDQDEDLEVAAIRELYEETGLSMPALIQLRAFGKPHRDPRGHMVSIAFTGIVRDNTTINAGDDAADAQWFSIDALPELAFDHEDIIQFALKTQKL